VSENKNDGAAKGAEENARNPAGEGLFSPLIDEILGKHHRYVREELPRIGALLKKCAYGCGESKEAVGAVTRFFGNLAEDIEAHLVKEEDELFPALRAADQGRNNTALAPLIGELRAEHDQAGDALMRTQVSLTEALLPEGAEPEIKELHRRLQEFETDLRAHVRAEDLLFARATGLDGRPTVGRR